MNANYSCPAYSYVVPEQQNVYEVFSANVIVGNEKDYGPTHDISLKEPP